MVFKNIIYFIYLLYSITLSLPPLGDLRVRAGGAATDFRSNFSAFSHYGL